MQLTKTQKSIITVLCIILIMLLITLGILLAMKQKQKKSAAAQDTQPAQTAAQQAEDRAEDVSDTEAENTQAASKIGKDVSRSLPADFSLSLEDYYGQTMLCRFPMTLDDWIANDWEYLPHENEPTPEAGKYLEVDYLHHEYEGLGRIVYLTVRVPADYDPQTGLGRSEVTGVHISCHDQGAPEVYYRDVYLVLRNISVLTDLLGEPDEILTEPYAYASDGCYYYYGDNAELIVAVYDGSISEIDYRLLTE